MAMDVGGFGVVGSKAFPPVFEPPLQKRYFNVDNLLKTEPLVTALLAKDDDTVDEDIVNQQYEKQLTAYADFQCNSRWDGKVYDLVFYGVSGYTGYLMMEYLKRTCLKSTKEAFTFAFAGRTVSKVHKQCQERFRGTEYEGSPVLQMSYDNIQSVIDLVRSARVVVNVAGPYMLTQGELLIDACCMLGRHYVDISGEIPWSLRTLQFEQYAMESKSIIVPSAASAGGFPDLLVYMTAKLFRERHGEEVLSAQVYCSGGGATAGASGGTLKTRAAMSASGDEVRKQMADVFSLGGFIPDIDRHGFKNVTIEFGTGTCRPKVRPIDIDATMSRVSQDPKTGVWRGPFVYSYFDTRMVRRSNMLFADLADRPYGRNLNFLEFGMMPDPSSAEATGVKKASVEEEKAALMAAGTYYAEGEGPPLEDLMDAWTGYCLYAETASGNVAKAATIGRDGYYETARVAIETALTLRFDRDELPFQGGVLTPIVATGEHLLKRMIQSNLGYRMGSWYEPHELKPPAFAAVS